MSEQIEEHTKLNNPPMIYAPVKESVIGVKLLTTKWSKIITMTCAIMILTGGIFSYLAIDRWFLLKNPVEIAGRENIDELEKSWENFQEMTGADIRRSWELYFQDMKYETEGNPLKRKLDCVGAIELFYKWYLHSLFPIDTIFKTTTKKMLSYIDIKSYEDIKKGDLVILTYQVKVNNKFERRYHVGSVYEKSKTRQVIRYCDMDYDGAGSEQISFFSKRFVGCISVTKRKWKGII